MNTPELKALVAAKFCAPAYGVLWEVGNATGFGCNRHCDGLAMSLWPSRGLELIGLELKASRGDWVKELKAPAKAESIARYCDRWYLVAGDASIVKPGELPATWGLIVPKGKGLTTAKEAERLKPEPLPRSFLAAIFRRSVEQSIDKSVVEEAERAGWKTGHDWAKDNEARKQKHFEERIADLEEVIETFRKETGIHLGTGKYDWNGNAKIIGKAVKFVIDGKHRRDLDELAKIEVAADRAKAAVAELRELYAKETE